MSSKHRLCRANVYKRPQLDSLQPKRVVFLSVEGNKTEPQYFDRVEEYKKQLGIEALVKVHVLSRMDTNSDPNHVFELLEELIQLRQSSDLLSKIPDSLKQYDESFIQQYIKDCDLTKKQRNKFEAALKKEGFDLLYLIFLSNFHGDNDVFGVVIDRDCSSHSDRQINNIRDQCQRKGWKFFMSNPCFEFWLLLHVSDVTLEYKKDLQSILENKNGFVSKLLHKKTNQGKGISPKIFEDFYLGNLDLAINRAKMFTNNTDELSKNLGSNLWELFELLREKL